MSQNLYIVFGTGPDAVGLVEKVTAPVAAIHGNIVDLRQDVLHGLFTLFMVVDLTRATLPAEGVVALVARISEETGLDLAVDRYQPVARGTERRNLLMILLGRDRPGIIAAVAGLLRTYTINIEISEMIAREGVFLMELMVDLSHCVIPLTNLMGELRRAMGELGIETLFQSEDVFNKRKRVLLFDLHASLMDAATRTEILRLAGIRPAELDAALRPGTPACLDLTAGYLAGLPLEVAGNVARAVQVGTGTVELIQTLKLMGYKVALAFRGFTCMADVLKDKLGIDHCFGVPLAENADAMTLTGELEYAALDGLARDALIARLAALEGVARSEVTVLADDPADPGTRPPGLRLHFDMKLLLDYHNQRILSREALIGLLGSFGPPAPAAGGAPQ